MKMAQQLDPVVMLGKAGMTDALVSACNAALDSHELVKLRFQTFKDERRTLAEQIAEQTGATLVQLIGNIVVLYREQPDPEKRRLHLE